jgi:transcriptional regulator with XRE-family HTH domain
MGRSQEWAGELTTFGKYLQKQKLDRKTVAKALDISTSYVSMLAHGSATPAFKLALKFARWTKDKFGAEKCFGCEDWDQD